MRILVTGSSGFVGGRLMERGAAAGHDMFGLARRPSGPHPHARVDLAAVRDGDVPGVPWRPDAIVHAAALAAPFARRSAYEAANVTATRQVVRFAERQGTPRLVYVSSSSVLYRDGDQLGLTEDSPAGPEFVNDYARTKFRGEEIVRGYPGSHVVARPRAVYGPGDTVLFPRVIAAARAGRLPLLTGRDSPAVGDLVYVDNLADHLLALATGDQRGVYHLTDAEPVDIQALLLDVLARLGLDPPRRRVPIARALRAAAAVETAWRWLRLPGEPPVTRYGVGVLAWSKTFDVSRMLRDLGPPAVGVPEGVDAFVAWQRERM